MIWANCSALGLIAIPHGLAVIATLFRLFDRHRMRRLWWDDFWAFVALLMDIPLMIAFFLRPESGSGCEPSDSSLAQKLTDAA